MSRRIIAAMRYRGPDDSGFYHDQTVALGSCRLSIVDVEGGVQPLYNEDRNLVLVCNGEIYNYRHLRSDLVRHGHRFETGSDAEVILHLYEEKGIDCIHDIAGMFAFALWDRRSRQLTVARDRIGIKPLYCYDDGTTVIFSSEFGSITRSLGLSPAIDLPQVWEFLCYGHPVDPRKTVDRQIQRVGPAEIVTLSPGEETIKTYWQPIYGNGDGMELGYRKEALQSVYLNVLDEHLDCEVPWALMLSGGLDSTSIAQYAVDLGYSPRLITMGYQGDFDCDERRYAKETAQRLSLEQEEVALSYTDYRSAFDELMHFCDEPVADIACIPQWKIFQWAGASGYKVLLNGLGGDEVFYGYDFWNDLCVAIQGGGYRPYFEEDDVSGIFSLPAMQFSRAFLDQCAKARFREAGLGSDRRLTHRIGQESLGIPDKIYHYMFVNWLPGNCLHLSDRLSMAHSVELRVPLIDHRLVEFVQHLPAEERFYGRKGKHIFKQLLVEKLGESFVNRPKQGFTPPGQFMHTLIREGKELIFQSYLADRYLDLDIMAALWTRMANPEIWFRLLVFEKWLASVYTASDNRRGTLP